MGREASHERIVVSGHESYSSNPQMDYNYCVGEEWFGTREWMSCLLLSCFTTGEE